MSNMLARAHKAAGDMVSAVVFLRIAFRYHQAVRAGREWTAQSYDDLMGETGCSQKQIKRALAKLREADLIVSKQGLFGNRNVNHFQLTGKGLKALEGPPKQTLEGPPKQALQGPLYIQGETTGSDNMEFSGKPPAKAARKGSGKLGKGMTVSEVLASQAAKKHHHKPDTVKQLEFVWKETFAEVYDQGMVHLTKKQAGLLKHFLAKCPQGSAAEVLEWAIRNWIEFVKDVETKAGTKWTPSHPDLEFLLKHAWIAVDSALSQKSPEPVKQEATAETSTKESVQLISQDDDDDQPKTFEELMAILGSGDKSKL
ncbi:hypothetical protein [Nitratireductor sp. OM-1]|uniref:hypothetical protein n=1 Tax=Nitratireductor sp. OM-1 TaxID=1756988 RepID=UPI000DDFC4D1|nr:hypothetical protein [Nitratireductor sp. OM-1]